MAARGAYRSFSDAARELGVPRRLVSYLMQSHAIPHARVQTAKVMGPESFEALRKALAEYREKAASVS